MGWLWLRLRWLRRLLPWSCCCRQPSHGSKVFLTRPDEYPYIAYLDTWRNAHSDIAGCQRAHLYPYSSHTWHGKSRCTYQHTRHSPPERYDTWFAQYGRYTQWNITTPF